MSEIDKKIQKELKNNLIQPHQQQMFLWQCGIADLTGLILALDEIGFGLLDAASC